MNARIESREWGFLVKRICFIVSCLPELGVGCQAPDSRLVQVLRKMEANLSNYDAVLYPSYTHPQTHPDRLSVIGTLFGLRPAPVEQCRVLELGCGNGTNLAPMAWGLPRSEFVGIDLAGRP